MRKVLVVMIVIVLGGGLFMVMLESTAGTEMQKEELPIRDEVYDTELFIEKWMTNENGTLATYMKTSEEKESDLVIGRESLSESLGLWMKNALLNDDQEQFNETYLTLLKHFLLEKGFVSWRLSEDGEKKYLANALVDDLRISTALFDASERWNDQRYEHTAVLIGQYVSRYNRYANTLTDFYVLDGDSSRYITLSYIDPEALKRLEKHQLINKNVYNNMIDLLLNAPMEGPFFPKAYDLEKKIYVYDSNINMVDQSLVAYYRSMLDETSSDFLAFLRREMNVRDVIYGQYERKTADEVVKYESPAVYGWLVLYSIEAGEIDLAEELYERMIQFKSDTAKYKGGYSVNEDDTHIFDNIVPLLAEKVWDSVK